MTFCFHVSDDGLDGGTAAQLPLDYAEGAALLAEDEDATWNLSVVVAAPLF